MFINLLTTTMKVISNNRVWLSEPQGTAKLPVYKSREPAVDWKAGRRFLRAPTGPGQ